MSLSRPPLRFRSRDELEALVPHILAAPGAGPVRMILSRPAHGERRVCDEVRITAEAGLDGDHWSRGCWKSLPDGRPDPDVQVCMMMARVMEAIAGPDEFWPPAGDNLILDMDLTPANLPPGSRVRLGTVEMVITEEPHNGCKAFAERFGQPACAFVNTGNGKVHRFRGIYGRVLTDGMVRVGDVMRKL